MTVRKIDFISPGVKVNEIDNTGRPGQSENVGPTFFIRAERGPGMKPIKVESFSEFIDIFGYPFPGGTTGDAWRDGNKSAPSYGAYAAQAWLANSAPCNIVRLLGVQHTDATAAGEAGWETQDSSGNATGLGNTDEDGGAYGLFICDSASIGTAVTGTLAAVWYINEGSMALSGTVIHGGSATTGSATMVESIGSDREFKAIVYNSSGDVVKETAFNFNEASSRYIRKVFNTNPTLANPAITDSSQLVNYWLGQSYERQLDEVLVSSSAGKNFGILLGLRGNGADKEGSDYRYASQAPQTGWFFSQDLQIVSGSSNDFNPENMTNLFKFHGINNGEWEMRNLKISIEDIKPSADLTNPYGTFTVSVRMADDTDNAIKLVERFTNCTLDPASPNFIAEKIGDVYHVWDDSDRMYVQRGSRPNRSRFIRVEVPEAVEAGAIPKACLPFGVYGPIRHKGFSILSGTIAFPAFGSDDNTASAYTDAFAQGGNLPVARVTTTDVAANVGLQNFTASFLFPAPALRATSTEGDLSNPGQAFFGVTTAKSGSTRFDPSYRDMVLPLPAGYDTFSRASSTEYAWIFTLDDLSGSGTNNAVYSSGSRAAGTSLTAVYGDYKKPLNMGFDKFTAPLFGGFDGLDITEKDPFRNTLLDSATETTSSPYASIKRAFDSVSDPEEVETKLLCMPGLTHEGLTNHLVNIAEDRGDCVAIIDLPGNYVPAHENTSTEANRLGSIQNTVDNKLSRGLSSSRCAAYYPWLLCRDDLTGKSFWAPPSIGAIQAIGYTEKVAEPWIAPAGVNRGGLEEIPGVKVVGLRQRLRKKDRNKLAQSQINSIAKFPGSGIAIWDQLTFLGRDSALTQLDVRLLADHLKRELEKMALAILFEKNVVATWNRFKSKAVPFLKSVQARQGITEFKLVLDQTTTTPDLVDRNIMYAKLFVTPAQSIRHVEIDLNLQGASAV